MKIAIESTEKITTLDGQRCRVWKGTTERGIACVVFVARVSVAEHADIEQFEKELLETAPPQEDRSPSSLEGIARAMVERLLVEGQAMLERLLVEAHPSDGAPGICKKE